MKDPPGFRYDVFVSYSHHDKTWVVTDLVPFLEQAGFKVMYDDRFTSGVSSAVNMAQAVRESRRTLAVLTPCWVEGSWTGWEGLLAATAQSGTLIPLLLAPCQAPDWISHLTNIDISRPEQQESGRAKLLRDLSAPATVRGEPMRQGLEVLGELLQEEAVRRAVVAFPIHFREASRQIQLLNGYKGLHDLLHKLQQDCYEPISSEAERFPADAEAGENLQIHTCRLREFLEESRQLPGIFVGDEPAQVGEAISAVLEVLSEALAISDAQGLRGAVRMLNSMLTLKMNMLNTCLNQAAHSLPLEDLAGAMKTVGRKLGEIGVRRELVDRVDSAVLALEKLASSLAGLVTDHDRWQRVELELRQVEGNLARSVDELESYWPYLKKKIEPLYAERPESWALTLKATGARLDLTLTSQDPVKIRDRFKSYRRVAGDRFFKVDDTLYDQCRELIQIAEPLDLVLRTLE